MVKMANIFACLRGLIAPSTLMPNVSVADVGKIDFAALEKIGVSYVGFDKDNTLTKPGELKVDSAVKQKFEECKRIFPNRVILVSNSRKLPERYDKELGIEVFRAKNLKPLGGMELIKWIREREKMSDKEPVKLAFFGDRVLTDVLYANKNDFLSFLVTKTLGLKGESRVISWLRKREYWLLKKLKGMGVKSKLPEYVTVKSNEELRNRVVIEGKSW